jgi:hypothetical protein
MRQRCLATLASRANIADIAETDESQQWRGVPPARRPKRRCDEARQNCQNAGRLNALSRLPRLAEQRRRSLVEAAGRHIVPLKNRQQPIQARGPAGLFRQDRRGELEPSATLPSVVAERPRTFTRWTGTPPPMPVSESPTQGRDRAGRSGPGCAPVTPPASIARRPRPPPRSPPPTTAAPSRATPPSADRRPSRAGEEPKCRYLSSSAYRTSEVRAGW